MDPGQLAYVATAGYEATPTKPEDTTKIALKVEIEVARSNVRILVVPSFEEVRPLNLMEMKLYELTTECKAWGIAVSGQKADLQNRLNSFFRGEPVLRKGCSKQFIQSKTEIEESGTSSSQMPLMPKAKPKAKMTAKKSAAKPASKPLTGHKAQAYSYASEQEEEDLSKINDDPVDFGFDPTPYFESAEGSPSIGGTFRGSPSPRATNIPAHIVDLGKD